DWPSADAKAMRKGAWVSVTRRADVRRTEAVAPTSTWAAGSPGGGARIAYEWSRPSDGPGAKRTRTIWGGSAETATVPWAFWNTRAERSRFGAAISPREAHWAAARATGRSATKTKASARARRRTRFTGDLHGPRGP